MKCVKMGDVVERVSEETARTRVKAGWVYCPKADWRKAHPGKAQAKPEAPAEPVLDKKARWAKGKRDKAEKAVSEAQAKA
jgi:hypothetical protein